MNRLIQLVIIVHELDMNISLKAKLVIGLMKHL